MTVSKVKLYRNIRNGGQIGHIQVWVGAVINQVAAPSTLCADATAPTPVPSYDPFEVECTGGPHVGKYVTILAPSPAGTNNRVLPLSEIYIYMDTGNTGGELPGSVGSNLEQY